MATGGDYWTYFWGTALGILHSLLVTHVYYRVPEPYMDEIFHVDQTRRYCTYNFSWNAKITTPPALYLIAMWGFCGRERYVNSFLISFAFVGASRFRRIFSQSCVRSTALIVLLLPVLLQSSVLFYTDLLSLTTLLWAFSCKSPHFAAFFFTLSLFTRQTNIVWAGLYGAVHLMMSVDKDHIAVSVLKGLSRLWMLLVLALAFVVFFFLNGKKIVLGDHSAHIPVPHFMQIYYLLLFMCLQALPHFIFSGKTITIARSILKALAANLLACLIIAACVHFFTFEHPYLLADNRHFSFYVWRRWFKAHWMCRFLLVPAYLFALHLIKFSVLHVPRFVAAFFILATSAVLVPAHLLEPRYFIVPFVFWRLSLLESRPVVLYIDMAFQLVINCLTFYLFFEKPFRWSHEPQDLQRFMW